MNKTLWYGCVAAMMLAACGPGEGPNDEPRGPNGGKGDIIGEDDRRDEFSGDVSEGLRELAQATAMVIESVNVIDDGSGSLTLASQPLGDAYMMCPDEVFASQPVTGMCSAWLVAPDIMVTNGHCITSQADCEQKSFVFDFAITEEGADPNLVSQEQVVSCQRMLAWDNTSNCDVDFAVVKLDRPVTDRKPVAVRGPDEELEGSNLVIIGHPFGLPRKYALEGSVLTTLENGFTTNHDIFGGNSGSAIFDATSGKVQGLIACGGSNLQWEEWSGDWKLDRKTGQMCGTSCDGAGEFLEGALEPSSVCDETGERRRCVCDGQGQLVWEKRACLSFESQSDGTCSREQRVSTFTCETAPWLCATPYAQHTNIFSMYVDAWDVASNQDAMMIEPGVADLTSTIELDGTETVQAMTLFLNITDAFDFVDAFAMAQDLTITLTRDDGESMPIEVPISSPETGPIDGTSHGLGFNEYSSTQAFEVPFFVHDLTLLPRAGTYTLTITNMSMNTYTLQDWHLQTITKEKPEDVIFSAPCVGDTCGSAFAGWPDDVHESFDGRGEEVVDDFVEGTLDADWSVEVLDPMGEAYEVFKTRKSQTLAMTSGEFAIVRDFGEDIGFRDVTVDFRYDGEGWFQIWADDQILYTENTFAQSAVTVSIPGNARAIKLVLGATDASRDHELTLFDLVLSPPREAEPPLMTTSCQDGEVQYFDINMESYCLSAGCASDDECPTGGVCNFDEQTGVNLCLNGCTSDMDCTDGRACVDATEEVSICAFR